MCQISDYNTFYEENIAVHFNFIFKYVRSWGFNADESEEITQETMLIAWEKLHQLKDPDRVRSWLFTIAQRVMYAEFRKVNERNYYIVDSENISIENLSTPLTEVLTVLEKKEAKTAIPKILNQLDEKYKRVITLYYYHDYNLTQISEMTNINYSTIKTNHLRALDRLRDLYKKYEEGKLE